jgi:hypothetical protein
MELACTALLLTREMEAFTPTVHSTCPDFGVEVEPCGVSLQSVVDDVRLVVVIGEAEEEPALLAASRDGGGEAVAHGRPGDLVEPVGVLSGVGKLSVLG